MKAWLGTIFVLISGAAFGFLGIFGRWAFQLNISIGELLTWRFFSASLILFLALLIFSPKLLKINLKQLLVCIGLGLGGYAVFSTMYFESIKGVSVPLAAMLLFTFPLFVNIASVVFFKEQLSKSQWISLLVAMMGLVILLWGPIDANSFQAILFGLGSAMTYAAYVLVSGKMQQNIHPLTSSVYVMFSAGTGLYFFHQPSFNQFLNYQPEQFLCVLGIAIFCTILPLTLFLAGLQRIPSSQASIIVMIEPVVATIAATFILNEGLTGIQMVGGLIVLLGIFLNRKGQATNAN